MINKMYIIRRGAQDFDVKEAIWIGGCHRHTHQVRTTKAIYDNYSIFRATDFIINSFESTHIQFFMAKQSDYTAEEFLKEITTRRSTILEDD